MAFLLSSLALASVYGTLDGLDHAIGAAGGTVAACDGGYIYSSPDYDLSVQQAVGGWLAVRGLDPAQDVGLAVKRPDGTWVCAWNGAEADYALVAGGLGHGTAEVYTMTKSPATYPPFELVNNRFDGASRKLVAANQLVEGKLLMAGHYLTADEAGAEVIFPECGPVSFWQPAASFDITEQRVVEVRAKANVDIAMALLSSSGELYCSDDFFDGATYPLVLTTLGEDTWQVFLGSYASSDVGQIVQIDLSSF